MSNWYDYIKDIENGYISCDKNMGNAIRYYDKTGQLIDICFPSKIIKKLEANNPVPYFGRYGVLINCFSIYPIDAFGTKIWESRYYYTRYDEDE